MILLKDLFTPTAMAAVPEPLARQPVTSICIDSRQAQDGSLFFALPGVHQDGQAFIDDAVRKGARLIVRPGSEDAFEVTSSGVGLICCRDPRGLLTKVLARFYDAPDRKVRVVGITGTNGKTTSTYLLESIFRKAGMSSGVIGTVNYRIGPRLFESHNTTPGIVDVYRFLADTAAAGVTYCLMEVSSHALDQGRVDGIEFRSAIFTNLTKDHMDYHPTEEHYFQAKAKLFTSLHSPARAFLNADDPFSERLRGMTPVPVFTFGLHGRADIRAEGLELTAQGSRFTAVHPSGKTEIRTSLLGRHNVYNILGCLGVAWAEGVGMEKIQEGITDLPQVPGRLERIEEGQFFDVYVDYAHTPDALQNVLTSVREVAQKRILLVFGCGGDRDPGKRPLMGQIADRMADWSIVTYDNPRTEDPDRIIAAIVAGFSQDHYHVVPDRREAFRQAFRMAQPGDVVLIAGKGHEDYQIFKDRTISFPEREIVRECLREISRI